MGYEELENWLRYLLSDNANFSAHRLDVEGKRIVILTIYAASYKTVRFKNIDYIRIGSYKKKLKDYAAVEANLFINDSPKSRNEEIASLLRRTYICEERGVGWDRIAYQCELFKLSTPKIDVFPNSTRVTMFPHAPFSNIPMNSKKWTCYMHACLKQVEGGSMTNATLRERFRLTDTGKAGISRLIQRCIEDNLVRPVDPNAAPKYMSYIPFWA